MSTPKASESSKPSPAPPASSAPAPATESSNDKAVRGASFDTPEGRAAQGMKPDIGTGQDDPNHPAPHEERVHGDARKVSPDEKGKK